MHPLLLTPPRWTGPLSQASQRTHRFLQSPFVSLGDSRVQSGYLHSSVRPPPPLRPVPLKHNLDRIQEASLKVVFPTPKLSNANFLFFFYWHDAIPLPTTQISEVLSHQAKAGTVGGCPAAGIKGVGSSGFPSGALSSRPCTTDAGVRAPAAPHS